MLLDMNSSFPAMGKYWDCCPQGSVVLAARRLPGVIKGPDAQVAFSCVQPGCATGRMLHREFSSSLHLPRNSVARRNVKVTSFNASLVCCSPLAVSDCCKNVGNSRSGIAL